MKNLNKIKEEGENELDKLCIGKSGNMTWAIENNEIKDWHNKQMDKVFSLAVEQEKERTIKLIKEKGLHLGYANNIIDLINNA